MRSARPKLLLAPCGDHQFMGNCPEHELLHEGRIFSAGTSSLSPTEIEALVAERFPRKAYCTVEDWVIFHVDESPESVAKVVVVWSKAIC